MISSHRHEPTFVQGEARYLDARKSPLLGQ